MKYYVGIDIGGTKINVGILNGENELLANKVALIPEDKDCHAVLKVAADTLYNLLDEQAIEKAQVFSVGIGVPGTVSSDFRVA